MTVKLTGIGNTRTCIRKWVTDWVRIGMPFCMPVPISPVETRSWVWKIDLGYVKVRSVQLSLFWHEFSFSSHLNLYYALCHWDRLKWCIQNDDYTLITDTRGTVHDENRNPSSCLARKEGVCWLKPPDFLNLVFVFIKNNVTDWSFLIHFSRHG